MVGYKYRDLFLRTSIDKQLQISVDDGRDDITNEELAYENFELTESLCSEENLKFGVCESSQLKFRVLNNTDSLKNRIVTVKEILNGNNDELFCYGSYKIETDTMTSDRKYRDVVAYDALHDVISENYIEWYNKLEFPVTIKELRDSFAQEIGIEQADAELIFDDVEIPQDTNITSDCSGATVLQAIGELNACFAHIGRNGRLIWITLPDIDPPMADIEKYSANALVQYESYVTAKITKLQITAGNTDVTFGDKVTASTPNLYVISDNMLLNGMEEKQIREIGDQLLAVYAKYSYRPFSGEFQGNPCYEVGDSIRYYDWDVTIDSYIMQRRLSGIQRLTDSYSATAKETYGNNLNSTRRLLQTEINKVLNKAGLVVKPFTNPKALKVTDGGNNVAQISFKTTDDTVIVFAASIPLCMNLDGIVDVYYYLDTAKLNDEPFRQYYEKGEHTLSLVYTFEALKGTIANFSILMKTGYYESASRIRDAQIKGLIQFAQNGGTYEPAEIDQTVPACDIAQRATQAVIFSAGLEPTKVSVWDGTIEIEEKFKGIELDKTNIKIGNFTETVSAKTKEPETSGLSEVFAGIALTDSLIEIAGMKETLESKDTIRTHTISTQYKQRSVYSQEYVNDAEDTFKMRTDYKYISEEQTIDSGRMETISLDFTQYTAESVVIS